MVAVLLGIYSYIVIKSDDIFEKVPLSIQGMCQERSVSAGDAPHWCP